MLKRLLARSTTSKATDDGHRIRQRRACRDSVKQRLLVVLINYSSGFLL